MLYPRSRIAAALVVLPLAIGAHVPAASAEPSAAAERGSSAAIESRLLAPCCWVQTLDVHESEVASALRREIRERLGTGESAKSIEDDLVARHGDRIRAVDISGASRRLVPLITAMASMVLAIGLGAWLRRRRPARSGDAPAALRPAAPAAPDAYDERLDDELLQMDR